MDRSYRMCIQIFISFAALLAASIAQAHWDPVTTPADAEVFPASKFGSPPDNEIDPPAMNRGLASVGPIKLDVHTQKSIVSGRSRTGVQEVALIAADLGFFPKTVFVTRDIPVRLYITSASKKPLCMMLDDFQVRKQIRSQKIEEISFVPTHPGQYRFYCPINGMEGTLFVKDLVGSLGTGSYR